MPDKKKIVIVGGVAGGASCAARARRLDENAEITLFERGEYISFANCGLPYYIGDHIPERGSLLVQTVEGMTGRFAIDIKTQTEVTGIDRDRKEVTAKNLVTGEESVFPYDALVLAPGAEPVRPPIPGIDSDKIMTLRNMADTDRIKKRITSNWPDKVVVVGAGYIGLEMVEAFVNLEIKVTIVELLDQVMSVADPEMVAPLHKELRKRGVVLLLGVSANKFTDKDDKLEIETSTGDKIDCDFCLLAIGVKPENFLAKDARLEIGKSGGIIVDRGMRTSDPNIYAVGDAVEVTSFVCGTKTVIPLAGPANRQGRIAADNIFGRDSSYESTQGTAICKLFDLAIGMTGLPEKALRKLGMKYEKVYTHANNHAGYYPDAYPVTLKLLFDPDDGKILGAQAVGKDGIDKRIDILATAIRAGMTVHDLEHLELSYAPPFGSAKDPVNFAGFVASNIINGDHIPIHCEELMNDINSHFLLDVRDSIEFERLGAIGNAVNIPLPELRNRLDELPNDKEIIIYCHIGLRGYVAQRILMQKGYKTRNLIGGFRTYRDYNDDSLDHDLLSHILLKSKKGK